MRQLIVLALAVAGCAAAPPPPQGFRDAGRPIYSNAVADTAQLAGDWRQVAAFAAAGAPDCVPGQVTLRPTGPAGFDVSARLCLDGRVVAYDGAATAIAPGRLRLADPPPGLAGDLWLIWVDTAYRSLAVGTPSGQFGFVLDRGAQIPADRLAAAREVFDFNGYDTARLR